MELTKTQNKKIEIAGKLHNLKLILLHGSYANNTFTVQSDLDIALLGKKPIEFDELLTIYGELSDAFGGIGGRELDIKSLDKADPLFCYQISKNSKLLYGDVSDYNEFRAYAFINYFDSQDLFRLENVLINKFQKYLNEKYA